MQVLDNRPESAHPAALRGSFLVTLATLLVLSCLPVPALAATPELVLGGDVNASGELTVGGHLYVALTSGERLRRYAVVLVDENDVAVSPAIELVTDAAGNAGRQRLWTRTGVVGCDPGAVHDPASYQFKSFSEAEAELDGRSFRVLLLDGAGSPPAEAHAEAEVQMIVVKPPVKAYPSDDQGCLRTEFKLGESVYMAISHQHGSDQDYRIFVVDPQPSWNGGDPLNDVRGVVQTISVPPAVLSVELLWAAPVKGEYQIIIREGFGTVPGFDPATDFAVETRFSPGGSHNDECDPCIPP